MRPEPHATRHLSRPRLTECLLESLRRHHYAALIAPAGCGKSVLAWEVSGRWSQAVVRIRLTGKERDPVALFTLLFRRFVSELSGLDSPVLERMLRAGEVRPDGLDLAIGHLLQAMERLFPEQVLVVLDDLHLVGGEGAAVLARLAERTPAGWHWLFCGRPALQEPLVRALRGGVEVLGEEALRFDQSEVSRLYSECYGVSLSAGQVERLLEGTGGHALMVSLYRMGMHGIRSLASYLEESLPADDWEILLRWVLLPADERIDIDVVLGEGAARMLDGLVGQVPSLHRASAPGRFVLHDMVRETLCAHARDLVGEETRHRLLATCARELLRQGDALGAARVYHELSDHAALEGLMRRAGLRLLGQGYVASCRELIGSIPESVVSESPGLSLLAGSLYALEGAERARAHFRRGLALARQEGDEALELQLITCLLEFEGGVTGGYEHMDRLLERGEELAGRALEDLTPSAIAWVHTILGATHQLQRADYDTAVAHLDAAERLAVDNDLTSLQVLIHYLHFQRHLAQARYPAARLDLKRLHHLSATGRLSGVHGQLYLLALVNWYSFTGQHAAVIAQVEGGQAPGGRSGPAGLLVETYLSRWHAEALIALGRHDEARDWLEHRLGAFRRRRVPFLESQLRYTLAVALALGGHSDAARRMIEAASELRQDLRERQQPAYHELACGTVLLLVDAADEAVAHFERAIEAAARTERRHVEAMALCLLGLAEWRGGGRKRGLARIERAMRHVRRHQLVHLPGWEPSLMREVLGLCARHGIAPEVADGLARRLGLGIHENELVPLLRLRTLGELRLWIDDEGCLPITEMTVRQRALLGLLLTQPGLTCSHEMAQEALYPETTRDQARRNLDTVISRLRKVLDGRLGKGASRRYLQVRNGLIVLANVDFDAEAAEEEGRRLLARLRAGQCFEAVVDGQVTRFLETVRGSFLPLVNGIEEVEHRRARIAHLHHDVMDWLAEPPDDCPVPAPIRDLVRLHRR